MTVAAKSLSRLLCGYPAAVVVLALHFLVAAASVREKSNTFDEIAHVTAGFSYWTRHDYRLQPENGNLPQRWFALPLLGQGLKFPDDDALWTTSDVWALGPLFFFESGNDADALLWRARCMNLLVSVGLGLLVYAWSRRLFGPGGGMISLLLYATSPTILANASLATSDLMAAAFFTLSVGCLWTMFHRLSPLSFVGCWLALAGLFLSKMSALLIVPMGVALLIIRLFKGAPLTVGWRGGISIDRRRLQGGILVAAMLVQGVLVAGTIWVFYGCRHSAFREPLTGKEEFYASTAETLLDSEGFCQVIEAARRWQLLPDAYLFGLKYVYQHSYYRNAFLNGEYSLTGWWHFFPYTFLVKTPLPTFLVLILAAVGARWNWRPSAAAGQASGVPRTMKSCAAEAFYATAPLWILLAVYWTAAIRSNLNIGNRHLLPTHPAMFILAGAAGHWFCAGRRLRWIMSSAVLLSVLLLAVECLAIYPHYLAYFNRIAGGPRNGYKHLVDSSLDWGQDLPGLKRWLVEHDLDAPGKTPFYLLYFGMSSPDYYRIRATRLRDPKPHPPAILTDGVYCISATELQQVYSLIGGWQGAQEDAYYKAVKAIHELETAAPAVRAELLRSKGREFWQQTYGERDYLGVSRLCAYLRHRRPDDHVGYSILIYRLTSRDVEKALYGPVP